MCILGNEGLKTFYRKQVFLFLFFVAVLFLGCCFVVVFVLFFLFYEKEY